MNECVETSLIYKIAEEQSINVTGFNDKVIELAKDGVVRRIADLNSCGAYLISGNKYLTSYLLRKQDIPVVGDFMLENLNNTYCISNLLNKYGTAVVKPNTVSSNENVKLCTDLKTLYEIIHSLLEKYESVIISPFYDIKIQYRTFILDGNPECTYSMHRPIIEGDGVSTIEELLGEDIFYVDGIQLEMLKEVLKKGEKLEVSFKHNSNTTKEAKILKDGFLKTEIFELARKAAEIIGIKYGSVDIIKLESGELLVLDVDSEFFVSNFVATIDNGYNLAKKMYEKAILSMFNCDCEKKYVVFLKGVSLAISPQAIVYIQDLLKIPLKLSKHLLSKKGIIASDLSFTEAKNICNKLKTFELEVDFFKASIEE